MYRDDNLNRFDLYSVFSRSDRNISFEFLWLFDDLEDELSYMLVSEPKPLQW